MCWLNNEKRRGGVLPKCGYFKREKRNPEFDEQKEKYEYTYFCLWYIITNMDDHKFKIRKAEVSDLDNVLEVERMAFGEEDEARLVSDLLTDPSAIPILSLLAFANEEAVGHILFTKVTIEGVDLLAHILAPLAVKPKYQRLGIGGKLINEGHKILREMGSKLVFVLGHPTYYPKYGYLTDAGAIGFPAPYPIPKKDANAWMVISFSQTPLSEYGGQVSCAKMMDKEEYWRE